MHFQVRGLPDELDDPAGVPGGATDDTGKVLQERVKPDASKRAECGFCFLRRTVPQNRRLAYGGGAARQGLLELNRLAPALAGT